MNEKLISFDENSIGTGAAGPGEALPPWDGALYAANTGHHRVYDEAFLDSLPLHPGEHVLDLGCGSGDFTATVAGRVPEGLVVGLEPQPSLLDAARGRALPNQRFIEGRVQELGSLLPGGSAFDVVMSRSVLHWVPLTDHVGLLADVHRLLRPGGWYRAEFGGAGNIPGVLPLLDDISRRLDGPVTPWTFMDPATYLELVEQAGLEAGPGFVRSTAQRRAFDRESLLGWFRSQVEQAYTSRLDAERAVRFRHDVEARFGELARADGTFDQTFVRLDLLVRRPV
jgi:trans-aconitate methyltransferase